MPPKAKSSAGPSKKTELKKKEKVIEDKTFGLKNKKGAKQQKFIQNVEKQVKSGGNPINRKLDEARKAELEKKKGKDDKDLNLLFKPVATQKIEKGTDPKSVLCAFFKQGQCGKGDRCKFSHDLTIERKAEKRSLYFDAREDGEADTMDNWDEQKLSEVAEKKHGEADKARTNETDIICRFFLEAVEKSKYGWFWECPNGGKCIYRHALPPGFQLKKDKKKDDKKEDQISMEDLVEKERAALGSKLTKVTLESFLSWKKRKLTEKAENARKDEEKKRIDFRAGRQVGISGREMFVFNPELAQEGEDAEEGGEALDYRKLSRDPDDEDEDGNEYREINLDMIGLEASEADGTGSLATEDRLKNAAAAAASAAAPASTNGVSTPEEVEATASAIDENLFLEEDLDDLDDEIDDLDLSDSQ